MCSRNVVERTRIFIYVIFKDLCWWHSFHLRRLQGYLTFSLWISFDLWASGDKWWENLSKYFGLCIIKRKVDRFAFLCPFQWTFSFLHNKRRRQEIISCSLLSWILQYVNAGGSSMINRVEVATMLETFFKALSPRPLSLWCLLNVE